MLGLPSAANSTAALAASGQWVVVVWTTVETTGRNVYAVTSEDGAQTFGVPVRVNDVEGDAHVYGETPPRVAIAPLAAAARTAPPEIIVTWPSERAKHIGLRSASSFDGGRTFQRSVAIGKEGITGERGFQAVAVGTDRIVRAVWLDGRRDPGTPPHANAGADWDPMHVMFASRLVEGQWSVERRLATDVCGCCKTALALGTDGAIYVAFRNIYPGSFRDISFTISRDGGRTFSSPVRVSDDRWMLEGCPDDGPTMAVDSAGIVHVVWPTFVQGAEPAVALFHASTRDGLTFTPRQRIETLGSHKPSHPQLTADACGALTLVWDEVHAVTRRARMRQLVPLLSGGLHADASHVALTVEPDELDKATRRALMRQLTPLPSGDVRAGALHVLSGLRSAVYPVVAATSNGVVVAWTDVDRNSGERSSIALRRITLDSTCNVFGDKAEVMR
jgi:hypothetical protein